MDYLGSDAELMGGFAGRTDAICGAVECQRVSGALHYHFWAFVQRLHQYCTLQEIAELIKKRAVTASDWKDFVANLCCEHYPDEKSASGELPEIEKEWPRFKEEGTTTCGAAPTTWGKDRMGRHAPFLRQDKGDAYEDAVGEGAQCKLEALRADAAEYKRKFNTSLQFNQLRVQHHIHPMDPHTKKRYLPNTCKHLGHGKECKHDFPLTSRLNRGKPLLLCKGLVKKMQLKRSGKRSAIGQLLGFRNSEWLDGTSHVYASE